MARYAIFDYDKAMSAIVASANTSDEKSAIESVPTGQPLPMRCAVIRTSAIEEFFVLSSELLDSTPTLIVRDTGVVSDSTPPAQPTELVARTEKLGDLDVVVLDWQPGGPDQDLAGFMVYRDGVLIGVSGVLTFVDSTVSYTEAGEHVYDVHAVDQAQNKSQPATVTITL